MEFDDVEVTLGNRGKKSSRFSHISSPTGGPVNVCPVWSAYALQGGLDQ